MAPLVLICVTVTLTLIDREFLEQSGWSAVGRSDVQWPSLLMLGPHGRILIVAFVAAGMMVAGLGVVAWRRLPVPLVRWAAAVVVAVGIALCLVAFPPDAAHSVGAPTWQDRVHNGAYPVIPLGSIIGIGLVAAGIRRLPHLGWLAGPSLAVLAVAVPSITLTATDALGQLARFFLFGSLLVWFELLAIGLLMETLLHSPHKGRS